MATRPRCPPLPRPRLNPSMPKPYPQPSSHPPRLDHVQVDHPGHIPAPGPRPHRRRHRRPPNPQKPLQLCKRLRMVIDPQIQIRKILQPHHHHCRRLPPPLVPPRPLSRPKRRHQPLRQLSTSRCHNVHRVPHHRPARQHVPRHPDTRRALAPAPLHAVPSRPSRTPPQPVHHIHLPKIRPRIPCQRPLDRRPRLHPSGQRTQDRRTQIPVRDRLRRHCPNPGPHERAARAHREVASRHRHGKRSGFRIPRHDRPSHSPSPTRIPPR